MVKIRLPGGVWFYDPTAQLGAEGGFGCVYQGRSETDGSLAVKRLKLEAEQAAHRELKIASELQGQDLAYVMPILDAGQDPRIWQLLRSNAESR